MPWLRVVGVAGEVRESVDSNEGDVAGTWYVSYRQLMPLAPSPRASFVVRGQLDGAGAQAVVREAIRGNDRELAVGALGSMQALLHGALGTAYGLLAHWVAQRRRDLAVRAALGCAPGRLFRAVAAEGAGLFAAGATLGGLATWALARGAAAVLQGDGGGRVGIAVAAIAALALVTAVAAWFPARRAAGTAPWTAMRGE
jgi:hypothetical protein